jgi:hypothetical protein
MKSRLPGWGSRLLFKQVGIQGFPAWQAFRGKAVEDTS